jgi:hypothetical protein
MPTPLITLMIGFSSGALIAIFLCRRQHKEEIDAVVRMLISSQTNERKAYARSRALEDRLLELKNQIDKFPAKLNGDEATLY